jgi:hypothetical protein
VVAFDDDDEFNILLGCFLEDCVALITIVVVVVVVVFVGCQK